MDEIANASISSNQGGEMGTEKWDNTGYNISQPTQTKCSTAI